MLKGILTWLLITLSPIVYFGFASAQANDTVHRDELPEPWSLLDKFFQGKTSELFPTVLLLREHEDEYRQTNQWGNFSEAIGTFTSYLGNYQEAIDYFDALPSRGSPVVPPLDEACVHKSAIATIVKLAKTHQVIFINEAHHVPQHRAFTIELVKALRPLGFNYFAAETLYQSDIYSLNQRGYPLVKTTGFYSDEPVYGNLIRTALELDYDLVAYESEEINESRNQREEAQAVNLIERILKKDPNAKFIVHAGYRHIAEIGSDDWKPMAEYFKTLSSIDPLTIDQTSAESFSPKEAVVFSCSDKHWTGQNDGIYDLEVFPQKTAYELGRPNWLRLGGTRKPYQLNAELCENNYPCLIEARLANEQVNAVPIDRIELKNGTSARTLMLPDEPVTIRVIDRGGEILTEFEVIN